MAPLTKEHKDTDCPGNDVLPTTADYDYIIIGAGPAGLQMAYFLQQCSRRYVVLEANEKAASFFRNQPRSNRLISINKRFNYFDEDEFNLRHDWNSLLSDDVEMRFTKYSDELYPKATDLHRYMNDFINKFQLNIQFNTRVTSISKSSQMFTVTTASGSTSTCRCLLMATGALEENLPETISGIELVETYGTHDLDKSKYENKMILIMGGGNSAFETAHHFSDSAAIVHVVFNKRIQFAWNTHYVGDLRAINNNIIDMYHLKSMHSTVGSQIVRIRRNGENGKLIATYRDLNTHWQTPGWLYFEIEYDHIISCMGWRYIKPSLFDETISIATCRNGRYPELSSCWETSTENLFYIGAAMAAIDRQSASGFIHGFRYNIRTLHHLLENRYFDKPLPNIQLPAENLQALAEKVIQRVSVNDSLHQMNGFLCDVISFDKDGTPKIFTDLPRNYVMERPEFKMAEHIFVLYLNYSFDRFGRTAQPVDNVHAPDFSNNRCGSFLHPFLEYYSKGEYVDQTELQESFIVRFDQWPCDKLPQWKLDTNINYLKFFINDKLKWTDEVFNLLPLPAEIAAKVFVPLTEEEMSRLPSVWEPSECKPSQELLPASPTSERTRVLRPTMKEVMVSAGVTDMNSNFTSKS